MYCTCPGVLNLCFFCIYFSFNLSPILVVTSSDGEKLKKRLWHSRRTLKMLLRSCDNEQKYCCFMMNYVKFLFGFLFYYSRSSTQWVKGHGQSSTTMLNADMTIYKQFRTHGKFDTPSCSYNTCPDASTANVVRSACQTQLICYMWRCNIVQPMLLRVCHNRY